MGNRPYGNHCTGRKKRQAGHQVDIRELKGKSNPIVFTISIYGSKATASLKVDRTKYDVKYGSTSFFDGLKDKAIYDEFDLVVDLEF